MSFQQNDTVLEDLRNDFIDIFMALPIWYQKDALESIGVSLKLKEGREEIIESEKIKAEIEEDKAIEIKSKEKAKEFVANMYSGMEFKEAWDRLFKN